MSDNCFTCLDFDASRTQIVEALFDIRIMGRLELVLHSTLYFLAISTSHVFFDGKSSGSSTPSHLTSTRPNFTARPSIRQHATLNRLTLDIEHRHSLT
jgi:hypothetical protein